MNLQSRSVSEKRQTRRRASNGVSWTLKLYTFIYLLAMAAMAFGIANYRIRLNRQISDLQRAAHSATRECANLDLDIQALKLQRDELTGSAHIRQQIIAYKLPLRSPEPAQVRHLAVRYRQSAASDSPVRVTAGIARHAGDKQLTNARP